MRQNFADPAEGFCVKTNPTGGDDDEAATCLGRDLTLAGVVASELI